MHLFTIFGDPVSHSRSPLMHNHVFKTLSLDACYTRTHLGDGMKLRDVFFSKALSGANITVPHKEAAFAACDEIRGIANEIGAVNTIINENGRLIGYNTDADGFIAASPLFYAKIKLNLSSSTAHPIVWTIFMKTLIKPTVGKRLPPIPMI